MGRVFNVSADCKPGLHYMVNLEERLAAIKSMVDRGDYFTINRARQYGKTTTLKALERYLWNDYEVLGLDFQKLSHADFETESSFAEALSREILKKLSYKNEAPEEIKEELKKFAEDANGKEKLADLFHCFSRWCEISEKPVVLMIDEVDSAANHQVFLDFLAMLRAYYIDRDEIPAFWSVILAGVYDVKNLKNKFVSEDGHKVNSPWNIAADFLIDMSFSAEEIAGMLIEYESDHKTGMNVKEIADFIYDYTSGYPFLVSRICKLMDERITGNWTRSGALEAVKILLTEKNTLFESLVGKLTGYPKLHDLMYELLFNGTSIPYNPLDPIIEMAEMFGIIKNSSGNAIVANRIFETIFYNYFLSEEAINSIISKAILYDKEQ